MSAKPNKAAEFLKAMQLGDPGEGTSTQAAPPAALHAVSAAPPAALSKPVKPPSRIGLKHFGGYLDDELDMATSLEFRRHLRECPECSAQQERQEALRNALRTSDLSFRAPAGLEQRIRNAVRQPHRSMSAPETIAARARPRFPHRPFQPSAIPRFFGAATSMAMPTG